MKDSYENMKLLEGKDLQEAPEYEELKEQNIHPEHIIGKDLFTNAIFEEISDKEDEFEAFFTSMFFLGITMIPLQIILSDLIKPYDATVIELLQSYLIQNPNLDNTITFIGNIFMFISSMKFLLSLNVFFYLCIDPGVNFKVSLITGLTSYIVYILKLIIHDPRPFWVYSTILSQNCQSSYGCPALNIFGGMVFLYYLGYCINRALRSDDIFVQENKEYLEILKNVVNIFIIILFGVGFFLILFGENFIYQVILTYFYMFIFIRILIVFNKEIDHVSNGARYIFKLSNEVSLAVFFTILVLSLISVIFSSIVKLDLEMPLEWRDNLNKCGNIYYDSGEVALFKTLKDSCLIFNILGATFGVNLALKKLPNPYIWWISSLSSRIIRGTIGFLINYLILTSTQFILFRNQAANYIVISAIDFSAGLTSFGILPIAFSYINLVNNDKNTIDKVHEFLRTEKSKIFGRKVSLVSENSQESKSSL